MTLIFTKTEKSLPKNKFSFEELYIELFSLLKLINKETLIKSIEAPINIDLIHEELVFLLLKSFKDYHIQEWTKFTTVQVIPQDTLDLLDQYAEEYIQNIALYLGNMEPTVESMLIRINHYNDNYQKFKDV